MMEDNLRRALAISDGSISFLWKRPITLVIMVITLIIVTVPMITAHHPKKPMATSGEGG